MNPISRNAPTFPPFNAILVTKQDIQADVREPDKQSSMYGVKTIHSAKAPPQAGAYVEEFDKVWNIGDVYNTATEDDMEIFKFFIAMSPNLNVDMKNIRRDLRWDSSLENNKLEIVRILKKRGVDLNQQDDEGYSLMHLAVAQSSLDMAKALYAYDVKVDLQNLWGRAALHNAIELENCHDIAVFLISKSNNLDLQDSSGQTFLHIAVKENHIKIARLLVKNGANPDWLNDCYESALDIALKNGNAEMIALLKANMRTAL